ASITRVSSESSTPSSVVLPSASEANSKARLEMLFEPGKCICPVAVLAEARRKLDVLVMPIHSCFPIVAVPARPVRENLPAPRRRRQSGLALRGPKPLSLPEAQQPPPSDYLRRCRARLPLILPRYA